MIAKARYAAKTGGRAIDQTDVLLRRWPTAGLMLLTLAVAFGAALHVAH